MTRIGVDVGGTFADFVPEQGPRRRSSGRGAQGSQHPGRRSGAEVGMIATRGFGDILAFLFSFLNDEHEQKAKVIVRRMMKALAPVVPYKDTAGSAALPVPRSGN